MCWNHIVASNGLADIADQSQYTFSPDYELHLTAFPNITPQSSIE